LVAAETVRLGVDRHELDESDRLFEQFQAMRDTPGAGRSDGRVAEAGRR
jgi:hypothetical protein